MRVIRPDEIDFAAYVRETEARQKVRPASEYIDEVVQSMLSTGHEPRDYLPWAKTHQAFQFRPGEVTLWAGVNGHGKSLVTGLAGLSLMGQSCRVCIASFEMKPKRTLERMARQWSTVSPALDLLNDQRARALLKDTYEQFGDWTNNKLWLYDQQGTVECDTVLGVTRYCAKELGINHIFIDSLMKCVKGDDDYNAQKAFVDELCSLARDCNIHIHLVHHLRKLSTEESVPDKNDVKGTGGIVDQVDNLLIVWRNKKKEKAARAGDDRFASEPDCLLICDKQRNGEWEGQFALWLDPESKQLTAELGGAPLNLSDFPHGTWQ